jgi:hypothetical protein
VSAKNQKVQALIARMPYAERYETKPILDSAKHVDERGLICVSVPINVEAPEAVSAFIQALTQAGLTMVAMVSWFRDRHIVTTKSKRLTNCWEPIVLFSKSKDYILNREAVYKMKRGFEGKDNTFDEDEFLTCIGDHWPVRNDRRDRRFLPATIVLNCAQLADLKPGDAVIDPFGNPGVKETCANLGWKYVDSGYPSNVRGMKKGHKEADE